MQRVRESRHGPLGATAAAPVLGGSVPGAGRRCRTLALDFGILLFRHGDTLAFHGCRSGTMLCRSYWRSSPLSRAEVEGFVFSDMRFLAEVVPAGAVAPCAGFAGADRAVVVLTVAVEVFAAVVFTDALPLPDWGALEGALSATLSVALAFAIGTLTFASTGRDFAIQTGHCSTSPTPGFHSGKVFT